MNTAQASTCDSLSIIEQRMQAATALATRVDELIARILGGPVACSEPLGEVRDGRLPQVVETSLRMVNAVDAAHNALSALEGHLLPAESRGVEIGGIQHAR